jgi:multisubunit Na+/H+ antiporter MnhB subunit
VVSAQPDHLVRFAARVLLGPGVVVAFGLMVKGYTEVGDGFAAGVIVGLLIALHYLALGGPGAEAALPMLRYAPVVAVSGILLGLGVGFSSLAFGRPLFTHSPGRGQSVTTVGTLELFTPFLFDLGVFLLVVGVLTMLLHQFAHADDADDADLAAPSEPDTT